MAFTATANTASIVIATPIETNAKVVNSNTISLEDADSVEVALPVKTVCKTDLELDGSILNIRRNQFMNV